MILKHVFTGNPVPVLLAPLGKPSKCKVDNSMSESRWSPSPRWLLLSTLASISYIYTWYIKCLSSLWLYHSDTKRAATYAANELEFWEYTVSVTLLIGPFWLLASISVRASSTASHALGTVAPWLRGWGPSCEVTRIVSST